MRSLLTRRIFRQIVRNEIFSSQQCWCQPHPRCLRISYGATHPVIAKRSLFGFSRKPKRRAKPVDYDPGYAPILELSARLKVGARTQPQEELVQAFVEFFRSKQRDRLPLQDVQAEEALTAFQHLQNTGSDTEGPLFTTEDLRLALQVLKMKNTPYIGEKHNRLARALFAELQKRWEHSSNTQHFVTERNEDLLLFIQVMAHSGDALYARDLIEQYWDESLEHTSVSPWLTLLRGLVLKGQNKEVEKTIDIMQKYDISYTSQIQQVIIANYAAHNQDLEMTKKWYNRPLIAGASPTVRTDLYVMKLCIKRQELEWGDSIFKPLLEKGSNGRSTWNIILQWSAVKGKSVDEIERIMQVMIRRGEEVKTDLRPDIDHINGLIEVANSRNDPYTAERYVALGHKLGLQPNSRTFLLQLAYRLKVGDLGGARAAYAHLQGQEVPDHEDLPLINKLIVALCAEPSRNYDSIMVLVEDLSERKARFEPDTVAALSLLHLQRAEMDDLADLLNTYVFHYGMEQRASIRDVLLRHCLDPSTPTSNSWETYNILRQTFTETDRPMRTLLMENFFTRERSDMASHVFGHMRQQQIKSLRPTIPTYASCLSGISRAEDSESLQIVHNMIKLDSEIDPDTQLRNALMLGYSGCGDARRALDFFEEIIHSREGPSYATFQIALRACEKAGDGEAIAREIWSTLQRFEIEVTREIYAAYVGALAGQKLFEECVRLIHNAEKAASYKPDALLLGTFYNATRGSRNKLKVKEWAWATYPSAYEDLLKLGQYTITRQNDDGLEAQRGPEEAYFDIGPIGRNVNP